MKKHDVVIVGAGPAGLSAAVECAKAGVDALLIEKDDIFTPKKSIEAFASTIESFRLNDCVIKKIRRDRYLSLESKTVDIVSERPYRAVIDQQKFNELMVKGINYRDKSRVVSAERKDGNILLKTSDGEEVETRMVIDATGYSADISRMLGKRVKLNSSHLSAGYQVKGDLSEFGIDDETCLHLQFVADTRFGKRIAELWLYPFSENLFDIGWGYHLVKNDLKGLKGDALMECRKEIYPELRRIVKEQFGVELGEPLKEYYGMGNTTIVQQPYSDNLLITGEAMGMVQPIYFYGFESSLVQGKIAGKVASRAVREKRCTERDLKIYAKLIGKDELFSYARENMLRELIIAGGSIVGEEVSEAIVETLKK